MSTAIRSRRGGQRVRTRTSIVAVTREIRKSLMGVIENTERTRRDTLAEDGLTEWHVLTGQERLESLRIALVWLQRAENQMPQLRTLIERQMERESGEVF